MNKESTTKKRIMFIKGDDFYFMSYNILLLLLTLKCFEKRTFKDCRKLPFITEFISNKHLVEIIDRYKNTEKINLIDRELVIRAYTNARMRINDTLKLLTTLEKRGLVNLENSSSQVNIVLKKNSEINSLFKESVFLPEKDNIKILRKNIKRISIINLETLLNNLFDDLGIKRWEKY
jgi:hypothetical protein